jgi:hypothetical protein
VKPMIRRLRALERVSLSTAANEAESQLVLAIRARRTRRLQLGDDHAPVEVPLRRLPVGARGGRPTIAEVIRYRRYGASVDETRQ